MAAARRQDQHDGTDFPLFCSASEQQLLSWSDLDKYGSNLPPKSDSPLSPKASALIGDMLHSANGEAVVANHARAVNAVQVRTQCVEWAPPVDFVNKTVLSLEAAVAKGAKLKCRNYEAKLSVAVGNTYSPMWDVADSCRTGTAINVICVFAAGAILGPLETDKWVQFYITWNRLELTINLGSTFMNLYARM
ncbi:uncharacterized protein [Aristolochia californica]|uniref:uncharacterized protein n=1 Tax=Aristolochia californica TaxID=171875 RepID=UPI0035E30B42